MEEVAKHIVDWLKAYARKSGLNGFVVGVSGGIDSAVTSVLCAETGLPVLCLEMPIHQQKDQVHRAQKHITWLVDRYSNVEGKTVDLTTTFDAFKEAVDGYENSNEMKLALANSRSRLRMTTLYQYSSFLRRLVVGTGNKVEDFGIGFFTKYGDGGVDLSPIADLMKSEVHALAEYFSVIPEIKNAVPTDGLWDDDRTDEQQIGASYEAMEWAMQQVEKGKSAEDFTGDQKHWMEVYLSHHHRNKHKMNPIPICIVPSFKKKD
jgi:NAD+ synthase